MRIGIDAKWFFNGPPSGRVVVRALTRELLALDTKHEWVVFVDGRATEAFPYQSHKVNPVRVWAGNTLLSNVVVLPWLAGRHDVDVMLYQNFVPPWGASRRVAMIYDVLFDSHPQYYTSMERMYFAPLKRLAASADRICTISESERSRLVAYGYGKREDIDVVHLGVDKLFRPLALQDAADVASVKLRLGLPDRFVLFVGRLNARKNVSGLMRAIALLQDRSVQCVVVGQADWMADDAMGLARSLGIHHRIHFVGSPGVGDLSLIYSLATVFCFPSFEEGFGLPALEAMASGVPTVVSNRSSLPEVCGDAAIYVDPDDPHSISLGIDTLLADTSLQDTMRSRGSARAALFTWRRAAIDVLSSLERAAAT